MGDAVRHARAFEAEHAEEREEELEVLQAMYGDDIEVRERERANKSRTRDYCIGMTCA